MRKLEHLVRSILSEDIKAREDDKYLITLVYQKLGINIQDSFQAVLMNKTLPSFESVTRARRKVQEKNPFLTTANGIRKRQKQEEKMLEYVRCTNCGEKVPEEYISTADRFINSNEYICLDCIENGYGG